VVVTTGPFNDVADAPVNGIEHGHASFACSLEDQVSLIRSRTGPGHAAARCMRSPGAGCSGAQIAYTGDQL